MHANDFGEGAPGRLVPAGAGVLAFVPDGAPATLELDTELIYRLDEASRTVASLAGAGETLPNPHLLIRPLLRREAVLSSRIEDTQASVSDVYVYEANGETRSPDTREVANYVQALDEGHALLERLPISARLVCELHRILMTGVRGADKRPVELRDRLVYIGPPGTPIAEARFVPPPHALVPDLLSRWERFVHDDSLMPPLIRCAVMHYQFETIHPFNDGNGRVGRLLIPLFLIEREVLRTPLLYLSAYFERHRGDYYDRLHEVSTHGAWRAWLNFFLQGVTETSKDAGTRVRALRDAHEGYRQRLQAGRVSVNALRLVDQLLISPILTAPMAARSLGITPEGARLVIDRLVRDGILSPMRAGRPQLYAAQEILDLIEP